MSPQKRPRKISPRTNAKRPGQDAAARKQAGNFPSVGMTLSSYKHDPFQPTKRSKVPGPLVVNRSRFQRIRDRITLKRAAVTIVLLVLATGVWVGGKFIYNAHKVFGGNILSILDTTKLKGEDQGRVNILLAGNSADDPGHDGANLTDSILVLSINTKDNTAFLLSIPRDLYVEIPGAGHQKINDAYPVGQSAGFSASGYPNGGMGQLEQIVSEDFGINLNYYALIDYKALKEAVDAVGGIQVTIKSSDPRGLFDPSRDYATHTSLVKLSNGVHTLSGEQALDLARARGDAYGSYGFDESDFTRTQNQRMMLIALKSKVASSSTLANPLKLSNLFDAVGSNVHTDLKLPETHRLYDLMKNIPSSSIQSLSLNSADGVNLLANYTTPVGQSALIPAAGVDDYNDIQQFITQQTSSNPVVREGATVVVLNATDTAGLATKKENELKTQKYDVTAVGNATGPDQTTTTIIDNSNNAKPKTKAALEKIFGSQVTTTNPYAGVYAADFIIVLGQDQVPAPTTTTTNSTN